MVFVTGYAEAPSSLHDWCQNLNHVGSLKGSARALSVRFLLGFL